MNTTRPRSTERGIALVIVLSILVVVSILLVTMITVSQTDRSASRNYSQSLKAEELGRGALDLIVADLQQEIVAGSDAVAKVPAASDGSQIYVPKTPASIVPARYGNGTGANVEPNLIRKSLANAGAVTAAYPGADYNSSDLPPVRASAVPTSTPSANRRSVSADRWNKPRLLKFPAAFEPPDWVYVSRSGANALTSFTAPLADSSTQQYVVGRFAYTIYDEGGLLDINLAGAPTGAGAPSAAEKGRKAFVGFADLARIPGFDAAKAEKLVNWRNAWSKDDYSNKLVMSGAKEGFLEVMGDPSGGDNTFLGRQDLIDYAQRNDLQGALPYLGTFSRELNSPSVQKGTNPALNPEFATFYHNGKPLRRFPIGKFALLAQDPSNLSSADRDEIQRLFGLTPATDANADFRAWVYRAATIGTLEAAISAGRAPDLFELMKAAIKNPSLGVAVDNNGVVNEVGAATYSPETNVHHQIARMVANLADQSDADNYPTTIRIGGNEVYGIESLPYFSEIFFKAHFPTGFSSGNGTLYCYFELWNPHQGPIPTDGPNQVRIRANPGARVMMSYVQIPWVGYATTVSGQTADPPSLPFPTTPITVPNLAAFQGNPRLADASAETNTLLSELTPPVNGWRAVQVNVGKPVTNTAPGQFTALHLRSFTPVLEFEGPDGTWHPYSTFAGHATPAGTTGIQGEGNPWMNNFGWTGGSGASANNLSSSANLSLPKTDPRTFRFRSGFSSSPTVNQTTGPSNQRYNQGRSTRAPEFPSGLANNQGANSVADLDSVTRPGDAYLGNTANPLNTDNTAARPIILNRPFRSVGEIGYAFRDVPWKTLDLFSGQSADAALLDIFSMEESDVVAGRVSPNTQNSEVLQALLTGSIRNEVSGSNPISSVDAKTIADQIVASTETTKLANRLDLLSTLSPGSVNSALPAIKTQREAAIRALAPSTQTRTWNLLIDVVAEVGRFAPTAANLAAFNVEGSRRFWLHVAIDRFTGEVVDSSVENVYE